MASGLVIHIEVGVDKQTEVLSQNRIRIGSSEDCELRIAPALLPITDSPIIELTRTNGHYRVGDFNHSLRMTHNGAPLVYGSEINDGDELRIEHSDLALQFYPVRELPVVAGGVRAQSLQIAPFIENAAIEAAATARRDDAKVFLREFTRELVREINTSTKVIMLLIAGALVGGVLYLGFAGFKESQRIRRLNDEQKNQLTQLKDLVDQTKQSLSQVTDSNQSIIDSMSFAPKLYGKFSKGVFLILGKYQFFEAGTNRPLRYPELQVTEDGAALQTGEEQQQMLTPDGNGPIAEFPYFGTGFHVGDGFVLTNRHVAFEPWVADETAQMYSSGVVGQPRIVSLLAYFPGRRQPIPLRFRQASQRDDIAVCVLNAREVPADIPTLPLDKDSDAATVGKAVVLMGYPTGYDRILANLPEAESRGIRSRYGASFDVLVGHLAERNLIKPLTTQGHITDFEGRRIVYDARTAEGGSGAPLFGQSGRVIGVNFAIFTEMPDANYAVPVRYAVALLERVGWKPQEAPAAENSNGNSNNTAAPPKDGRAAATNSNQPRQ